MESFEKKGLFNYTLNNNQELLNKSKSRYGQSVNYVLFQIEPNSFQNKKKTT
jgi:hypothetical protein